MTLPDCKDNVENDEGIADAPPVLSHNEAYGLINMLTMVGGTRWLRSHSFAASPLATAECGDEAIYKLMQHRITGFFCRLMRLRGTHVVITRSTST